MIASGGSCQPRGASQPFESGKRKAIAEAHPLGGDRHQDVAMPIDDDGLLVQLGGAGGIRIGQLIGPFSEIT